ncbi:cytochrome P450 [Streptomyces sp. NPDC015127]|uniref:cytochrome P450 n=1 Tax=Streptomyces sp. NPDC015127 TaxID=3364939 RepID=UPI0036FA773F
MRAATELCPVTLPGPAHSTAAHSYRLLRDKGPVQRVMLPGGLSAWLVTGHREIQAAVRDPRLVHDPRRIADVAPHGIPRIRYPLDWLSRTRHVLSSDAADHTRQRALMRPYFTPHSVTSAEPVVRRAAHDALDRMAERGGGDLVVDLALPVATASVCALLGVPATPLRPAVETSLRLSDAEHPLTPRMTAAAQRMPQLLTRVIAQLRGGPQTGLGSALLSARETGDLTAEELLGNLGFLLFAGIDSTVAAIPAAALHIMRTPGAADRLHRESGAVDALIENALRLAAPFVHGIWRFASTDVAMGGQPIAAGDPVVLCLAAANTDPGTWPDPWNVCADRPRPAAHLSFGHGPHYCPGAGLGRLQTRIALTELFRRFPRLALAGDARELRCRGNVSRHFMAVPVRTGA